MPFAYNFMPDAWHERMSTIVEDNEEDYDGSVQGRFNAWRMAFNISNDKVFAGGFDAATPENFIRYAPDPLDFHDFHSIYFQMLGKHGWGGLFIFLMMYYAAWRTANSIRKKVSGDSELKWARDLSAMIQVSLIAYATGGAFLGMAYFDLPFHFLITLVAVHVLVDKELQSRKEKIQQPVQSKTLWSHNP
ncbi:hypothetical protein GCM10009092_37300 [Bowmanella denitrificans]|uniref:O-antigen ligase-related domain-containing protein n=2 Tax=Bowmanella denitrificans TaxID=366582 RepID=A0ABN0XPW6_9ALTE